MRVSTRHAVFLALAMLAHWHGAHAGEPLRLRVLSYNIRHGEGMDGKVDLERIAKVIGSVKPDLVALQEVDQKTRRTGEVDQPAELARLTGMHPVFGGNIPFQGGRYGNALLSRLPVKRSENHPLPTFYQGEQRGVMEAEIEASGGHPPILFFVTHLDYRGNSRERPASAERINGLVAKASDRPAVVTGDLNDRIGSETLKGFETTWSRVNAAEQPTFPSDKPNRQIDFILFRPQSRWKVIEARVLEEPMASDHRPYFAVLELNTGSETPR